MENINFVLDLKKGRVQPFRDVVLQQFDKNCYNCTITIQNAGTPYDLTGKTIRVQGIKPDLKSILCNTTIVNAKEGTINLKIDEQMTVKAGLLKLQLLIFGANDFLQNSIPFVFIVGSSLNVGEPVVSTDEFLALTETLKTVSDWDRYFSETSGKIEEKYTPRLNEIQSSLDSKASKTEVFSMANMGQDVKEAMTGGSVAVVGKNAILTENIVDNQITKDKINPNNVVNVEMLIKHETYSSSFDTTSRLPNYNHNLLFCITEPISIDLLGDEIQIYDDVKINDTTNCQRIYFTNADGTIPVGCNISNQNLSAIVKGDKSSVTNAIENYITYSNGNNYYTINIAEYKTYLQTQGIAIKYMIYTFYEETFSNIFISAKSGNKLNVEWLNVSIDNFDDDLKLFKTHTEITSSIVNRITKFNINDLILVKNKEYCIYNNGIIVNYAQQKDLIVEYTYSGNGATIRDNGIIIKDEVVGVKTLKISTYRIVENLKTLVSEKTVNVTVKDNNISFTNKNMIFLGDSRTSNGTIIDEFRYLMNGKVTLYGTRVGYYGDNFGVNTNPSEGRSGWRCRNYCNDVIYNDVTNPFYNANNPIVYKGVTSYFDFSYYIKNQNYPQIDIVNILLGANDGFQPIAINYLGAIIQSIHSYNPNTKIKLMTEYISPFNQDRGYVAYKITNQYNFYNLMINEFNSLYYVDIVPIHVNIDEKYDWKYVTENVSERITTQVERFVDTVHLNNSAYKKIADTLYYHMI